MICPKCGKEQEERLDCKECGIVFSKYIALFQSPESHGATDVEASTKGEFQELQIKVRELSAKTIDIEFEKTERKKLRMDVKNLEEQIQKTQQQVEARFQQLENRLLNPGLGTESQFNPEIQEILKKSEEMGQKTSEMTDNINQAINQLPGLWEKTVQNSYQVTELRDQMAALRKEATWMKTQIENLQKGQTNGDREPIDVDEFKAIRRNLDELGQFISGLGRGQ